jgi:hypothetical protein
MVTGRKLGAFYLTGPALEVFTGLKAAFFRVGFLMHFHLEKPTKIEINVLEYALSGILL